MGLFSKQQKRQSPGNTLFTSPPPLQDFSFDSSIEGKITADLDLPPLPPIAPTARTEVPLPPTPEPSREPSNDEGRGMELPSLSVPLPPHRRQNLPQAPAAPLPPLPKLASFPPIDFPKISSGSRERQKPMLSEPAFPDLMFPEIPPAFRKPVFSKEDKAPLDLPDLDISLPPAPLPHRAGSGQQARGAWQPLAMEEHDERYLYMTMQDYCTTHSLLHQAKEAVKNSQAAVENCIAIKNRQDSAIDAYKTSIDQIQRKLSYVDKALFELQA